MERGGDCCFCLSQGGADATLDCGLRRWPEVGFREVGNCAGAGHRMRAGHGRLVSYVAGSTPGQAQPAHAPAESSWLRTTRLLRWLVACRRLVQLLLQLQQLAQLLNIG